MAAQAKPYRVETEFLRHWVEFAGPDFTVTMKASEEMAWQGVDIIDIIHLFRRGEVTDSDMLTSRGLWQVEGVMLDGDLLTAWVAVNSGTAEVELMDVHRDKKG